MKSLNSYLRFTIVLLFGVIFSSNSFSQSDEFSLFADSVMNASYKGDGPGAVILVSQDGKILFKKAYGMADIERGIANSTENLFAIGSMTKQFSAVAILKLIEEGKMGLTDDIRKYFPEYNAHGKIITIENLLTHTSGIPSFTEKESFDKLYAQEFSKDSIVKYFENDSLLFEPSSDWSYSNSGYFLLGLIIEKVSGMSYQDYVSQNIFKPLEMSNTYFGNSSVTIPGYVTGYERQDSVSYKPASYFSWSWPYSAGAIVSGVEDLLKWDEALYTDKIVKQQLLKKAWDSFVITNGQESNYGYGWGVDSYNEVKIIFHGGAINGFLCNGIRIPSKHLYVLILSNNTDVSPDEASFAIAMKAAGLIIPELKPEAVSENELKEYEGVYEVHRVGGRVVSNFSKEKQYRYITVSNDTIYSQRTGGGKYPLEYIAKDFFSFADRQTRFKFIRDSENKISAIDVYSEPVNFGPNEIENITNLTLPSEKSATTVGIDVLKKYIGKYDLGRDFTIQISVEGDRIFAQATGQDKFEIFPESERKFFLKIVDASIEFVEDSDGKVTGLILDQNGKHVANKIE